MRMINSLRMGFSKEINPDFGDTQLCVQPLSQGTLRTSAFFSKTGVVLCPETFAPGGWSHGRGSARSTVTATALHGLQVTAQHWPPAVLRVSVSSSPVCNDGHGCRAVTYGYRAVTAPWVQSKSPCPTRTGHGAVTHQSLIRGCKWHSAAEVHIGSHLMNCPPPPRCAVCVP